MGRMATSPVATPVVDTAVLVLGAAGTYQAAAIAGRHGAVRAYWLCRRPGSPWIVVSSARDVGEAVASI